MDGLIKVEETQAATAGAMPRRAVRNVMLLALCQALTQSCNTLMFASSALAVLTIVSPDMRMWANLPVTLQHVGVMLSVFPASMLMMRRGRIVDAGAPAQLLARYGRENLEEVFLDIARERRAAAAPLGAPA